MTPTVKTWLGVAIALGTLAHLFFLTGVTREDVLIHSAFLLFAGILIDPETFKGLAFWRRSE